MEKETLMGDIFDAPEIGSLFEPVKEEQIQKVDEVIQPSLFEKEEEKPSPDILETPNGIDDEGKFILASIVSFLLGKYLLN